MAEEWGSELLKIEPISFRILQRVAPGAEEAIPYQLQASGAGGFRRMREPLQQSSWSLCGVT